MNVVEPSDLPEPSAHTLPNVAQRPSPYDMLKQAILDGELAPGQPLVETALGAWYKVSRTPIREALRRLEQDGLVERGGSGLVVRRRSALEILDIYETRIVLEATVGRVGAERRTEHDLRMLHRQVQRCAAADPSDTDAMVEANRAFHRSMWQASHNESLIDLLERLNLHLARYTATTLSHPGRWEQSLVEHAGMVEALERRDGFRAYELGMKHFTAARDIRLGFVDDVEL